MTEARALVIGGGLAGLGAALFFRRLGLKVSLVERLPRLGSLARGFSRQGLSFETGFHYAGGLGRDGILRRYLDCLGILNRLTIRPLPDPGGETLRLTDSGRDFELPAGFEEFRKLLPADPAVDAFFKEGQAYIDQSPFLNPAGGDFDPQAFHQTGPDLESRLAGLPLGPVQKCLLAFRCLLYGSRPNEAALNEFSLVNGPYLEAAASFEGGGEALTRAFEAVLAEKEVEIRCGALVTALETDADNGFQAAVVRGRSGPERRPADFCVFTGPPGALPDLLPPGALRPILTRRLKNLKQTLSPFILFGAARRDFPGGRQFFIAPGSNPADWFDPERGAIYLSAGSGRDGRWPLTAVTSMPREATAPWRDSRSGARPPAYLAFKQERAESLRRRILDLCPELAGELEIVDSATDLSLRHYAGPGSGGGLYGRLHGLGEAPVLPMTRVGRLALAGQNIVLPGLLGVLVSAAVAVGVLMGPEKVLEVLRS
ncbi:MAG: FAD-dependent oxidoreductase [Candidatus Adiutrix sp.]|nr:FAD-dependent oxidoreductase [Candidatus Adiutrix sp.]